LQSFELAGPTDYFTDQDFQQFKDGRVGFLIDSTQRRTELVEGLGGDRVVIDPWPLHDDGHLSGFVTVDNIYLTPRALDEKHNVSLRFAEYMITPDSQSLFAETGLIPAISGSPVVLAGSGLRIADPLISQAMFSLVEGAAYPVLPQAVVYQNAMDIALQSVFNGFVTPEEALQNAYDDIISALADFETTPTT
jgi:ABC-type glycerol-3-phosphate transport system substrate-binding protein